MCLQACALIKDMLYNIPTCELYKMKYVTKIKDIQKKKKKIFNIWENKRNKYLDNNK